MDIYAGQLERTFSLNVNTPAAQLPTAIDITHLRQT
jgi:hypothetical protein